MAWNWKSDYSKTRTLIYEGSCSFHNLVNANLSASTESQLVNSTHSRLVQRSRSPHVSSPIPSKNLLFHPQFSESEMAGDGSEMIYEKDRKPWYHWVYRSKPLEIKEPRHFLPRSKKWWRRWDSNSRPKAFPQNFLRVQLMIYISPLRPPINRLSETLSRWSLNDTENSRKVFLYSRCQISGLQVNRSWHACCEIRQLMRNCCYF